MLIDAALCATRGPPLLYNQERMGTRADLNSGLSTEAGRIELWFGNVRGDYNPVVGLSPGLADPAALGADFQEADLAGAEQCPVAESPALREEPAGLLVAQGSY